MHKRLLPISPGMGTILSIRILSKIVQSRHVKLPEYRHSRIIIISNQKRVFPHEHWRSNKLEMQYQCAWHIMLPWLCWTDLMNRINLHGGRLLWPMYILRNSEATISPGFAAKALNRKNWGGNFCSRKDFGIEKMMPGCQENQTLCYQNVKRSSL